MKTSRRARAITCPAVVLSAFAAACGSSGSKAGATDQVALATRDAAAAANSSSASSSAASAAASAGASAGASAAASAKDASSVAVPPAAEAGVGGGSTACALSRELRGTGGCHFLVGMGNDLASDHNQDGAYTLGTTVDLHYAYLVGLPTQGGWPDWNAGGTFVDILAGAASAHGVTPMFTLYAMASEGDGNLAMTTDDAAMNLYWQGAKLLFQRLGAFDKPAVVQLEPDFWGYAMQHSADGSAAVVVKAHAPDCVDVNDDLTGMARCLIRLARMYAPKARVGLHASAWGGTVSAAVQFFADVHATEADFVTIDMLDRDAGCFEAHTDSQCTRGGGPWYWDETNQTSPNFHDHLAYVAALHSGLHLPVLWWQVPMGVPSATPGGTSGHYRDNRVHYLFSHVPEFVAAGGVGAVFGVGAGNQTTIATDGGQFKNAVATYFANPVALP